MSEVNFCISAFPPSPTTEVTGKGANTEVFVNIRDSFMFVVMRFNRPAIFKFHNRRTVENESTVGF